VLIIRVKVIIELLDYKVIIKFKVIKGVVAKTIILISSKLIKFS